MRPQWDFFVSYAQADRKWAEWIAWVLEEGGYRVLIQAWDFVPGSNWIERIQAATRGAARTIAVLSEAYAESAYGTAEWQAAWASDPDGTSRKLLVTRIASCRRPGLLAGVVGVDLFDVTEAVARDRLEQMASAAASGRTKPAVAPGFPGAGRVIPSEPSFPGGSQLDDMDTGYRDVRSSEAHLANLAVTDRSQSAFAGTGAASQAGAWTGGEPSAGPARPVVECDPIGLGVHRAIQLPRQPDGATSRDDLPAFVSRAHDGMLRTELDEAKTHSKLVVLVGSSSTGKTRSAVEAVRDRLADWRLLHPVTASGLIALADGGLVRPGTILWLNESQVYLEGGEGSAAAAAIRGLLARVRPLVVIGTLWPEYWHAYMRPPKRGVPDPYRQPRQLLDTAIKIDVPDRFDERDLQAAHELAVRDPRLAVALAAQRDHGVTQVLAGGPALIDRWQDAPSPYGKALITAAIDTRRLGHLSALPADLLQTAAVAYLSGPQLASAPSNWFDSALAYACEPVKGAIAPLTATSRTLGRVDGYLLADYLDQHGRKLRNASHVPDALWTALAAHTRLPGDLNRLGSQAASRARYQHARSLWAAACDLGDMRMAMSLRNLLDRAGYRVQAGLVLRQAAAAGDPEGLVLLADLLRRDGRSNEMEQALRQAAAAGHLQAAHDLATLLHQAGRDSEAEQALRHAIAAGDKRAWSLLAVLLNRVGREEDAEGVLRQAAEQGDAAALLLLAKRLEQTGRRDDMERLLRSAADAGVLVAVRELSFLMRRTGRTSEAEHVLRRAGARDTAALRMLADLLRHAGRLDEAEHVLRRAGAAGDASALTELAEMLRQAGRDQEAEQALRQAAARGDAVAQDRLLPAAPPRGREAGTRHTARQHEPTKRRARTQNDDHQQETASGKHDLSPDLPGLSATNRTDQEQTLRRRAAAGESSAARQLAVLLAQTNRGDEGERILRQAVLAGDPNALGLLVRILQQAGRISEASLLSRYGLAEDGTTAPAW